MISIERRTAGLAVLLILFAHQAGAVCAPFFPPDWELRSIGQTNLVVVDEGQITLIPNVAFQGNAPDFALVVPTPTVPDLLAIDAPIWDEASRLTRTRFPRTTSSFDDGCGTSTSFDEVPLAGTDDVNGVDVVSREKVGGFIATIVRADAAEGLIEWLDANGYAYTAEDAATFADYVDRDWAFTAMRLDPDDPANDVPFDGWDHTVDPVVFTYAADGFEVALPITGINRDANLPMRFYVVADDRTTLDGFETNYANRLNASEMDAIRQRFPNLAVWLDVGRTFVRLDRTFLLTDPMDASLTLERDPSQSEVYPGYASSRKSGLPLSVLPLALLLVVRQVRRRNRRHPRQSGVPWNRTS